MLETVASVPKAISQLCGSLILSFTRNFGLLSLSLLGSVSENHCLIGGWRTSSFAQFGIERNRNHNAPYGFCIRSSYFTYYLMT